MASTNKQDGFTSATPRLSMRQIATLIANVGQHVTVIVEGDMGSGKTSLLKMVSAMLKLRPVYFDCTTKDVGDLFLPRFKDYESGADAVSWVPNEEFGIHFGDDACLMFDEFGKNRAITNPLLRVLQERSIGNRSLSSRSVVFATTNLGSEGIGDMLAPHARNRVIVVRMNKPTADEWIVWGLENNINTSLLVAAREFPQFFVSYTDVEDFKSNEYIYDPRAPHRLAFVTPRSLEKASHILNKRDILGDEIVTEAMKGTVGAKAALDIMTFAKIGDKLPRFEQIVADPKGTPIAADSPVAKIMTVFTCVGRVEPDTFNPVFTYIERMPAELQALFAKQLMDANSSKQRWVVVQDKFSKYVLQNQRMFASA